MMKRIFIVTTVLFWLALGFFWLMSSTGHYVPPEQRLHRHGAQAVLDLSAA